MNGKLPDEVLLEIFSYLDPAEKTIICMSVCQRWRNLAQHPSLWRKLKLSNHFSPKKADSFLRLPFIQNAVLSLELSNLNPVPSLSLPNLQTLTVWQPSKNLKLDLPKLRTLIFSGWMSKEIVDSLNFANLSSLTTVHIECASGNDCGVLRKIYTLNKNIIIDYLAISEIAIDLPAMVEYLKEVEHASLMFEIKVVSLETVGDEVGGGSDAVMFAKKMVTLFSRQHMRHEFYGLGVLSQLSCQSLTMLEMNFITKTEAFEVVPDLCPKLQVYTLGCLEEPMAVVTALVVTPLTHLSHFYFRGGGTLTSDDLANVLSVWKSIEVLECKNTLAVESFFETVSRADIALEELTITSTGDENGSFPDHVDSLERANTTQLCFPTLKKLVLDNSSCCVWPFIYAPSCTSLEVCSTWSWGGKEPGPINLPTLALACPNVEKVSFDDATLGVYMLALWRNTLTEVNAPIMTFGQRPVRGLKGFATICPKIRSLRLWDVHESKSRRLYTVPELADAFLSFEDLEEVWNPSSGTRGVVKVEVTEIRSREGGVIFASVYCTVRIGSRT